MKKSYVTVTDQFCGAGGSSTGAKAAGAEVKLAMNHWKLAIETHNTNHPEVDHDCTDVSACDPRRYASTDILITSPECTNHSIAKGRRRPHYRTDLFGKLLIDPAEERSRATMWDVPRFAEYHDYRIIIVENVVDAREWRLYDSWLHAMHSLGYEHQAVYFNSMFAWPTPQSRDRMYVVFWKRGNKAPDLEFTPLAWCPKCERNVNGHQSWKNPRRQYGRYGKRGQYVYRCGDCASEVAPYYYPALTAIDWSLPIERIGDRKKPLQEKTLARIRLGLERFANQHLVMDILYSHAHNNRSHPITEPWPTQTGQQSLALVRMPFLGVQREHATPRDIEEALQTVVTDNQHFLIDPSIVELRNHGTLRSASEALATVVANGNHHGLLVPMTRDDRVRAVDEPYPTQTGTETQGLLMPFLTRHYSSRGGDASLSRPVTEPLGSITTADHHSLTIPPFLTSYYGNDAGHPITEPVPTVPTVDHHALVAPFIVSQYGGEKRNPVHHVGEPMMTVPGMQMHRLAVPGETPSVEDCGFRMLAPHEIQAAMAFPGEYVVLGNKREQVKQLGNAVTPPVMQMLIERCIATLGG